MVKIFISTADSLHEIWARELSLSLKCLKEFTSSETSYIFISAVVKDAKLQIWWLSLIIVHVVK